MIELWQFPRAWGPLSLSPFCAKVELFLKFNHIEYRAISKSTAYSTPMHKLPVIRTNKDVIADSKIIIEHLKEKYQLQIDGSLTAEENALSTALHSMVEEELYFIVVYSRWIDSSGKQQLLKLFSKKFKLGLNYLVFHWAQKSLKKQLNMQGLGRHDKQFIYQRGNEIIYSLSALLGGKNYFFGDTLCSVDISIAAFLYAILQPPIESPLKSSLHKKQNLVDFVNHVISNCMLQE